ncbi:hypothetical protein BGW42_008033 [Actinomortierella wolfii]|nr:hypothetical protein BGW42_008033 [Actinomortierella wolfii]
MTNPTISDSHHQQPAATAATTTTSDPTKPQSTMEKVRDKAMNLVEKVTGKPVGSTNTTSTDPVHPHPQPNQPEKHVHYDPLHPQTEQQQPGHRQQQQQPSGHVAADRGGGVGGGMASLANEYNAAPATTTDAHGNKVLNTMPAPTVVPNQQPEHHHDHHDHQKLGEGGVVDRRGAAGSGGGMANLAREYNAAPATTTDAQGNKVLNTMPAPTVVPSTTSSAPGAGSLGTHATTAAAPSTDPNHPKDAGKMTKIKNDILHPDDPTRPHTERHMAEMGGTVGASTVHPATAAVPSGIAMGGGIPPAAGAGGAVAAAPSALHHDHHHHHLKDQIASGHGNNKPDATVAAYHAGQIGGNATHVLPGNGHEVQDARLQHIHQGEQQQQHLQGDTNKPLPNPPVGTTTNTMTSQPHHQHQTMAPAGPTGMTAAPEYMHTEGSRMADPMRAQQGGGGASSLVPPPNATNATSTVSPYQPDEHGRNLTALGTSTAPESSSTIASWATGMGVGAPSASAGSTTTGNQQHHPGAPSTAPSAQLYPDPQGSTSNSTAGITSSAMPGGFPAGGYEHPPKHLNEKPRKLL